MSRGAEIMALICDEVPAMDAYETHEIKALEGKIDALLLARERSLPLDTQLSVERLRLASRDAIRLPRLVQVDTRDLHEVITSLEGGRA